MARSFALRQTQQHLWNALELVPKSLRRSSLAVSWLNLQDDDDVFVVIDDSEVVSQQLKKPIKNSCIVQMNIMNNGYIHSQKTIPAEEMLLGYSNIIEALNSTGQYPATGQHQQQQRNRQKTTNRRNKEWDYLPPTPQRNSSSSSSSLLVGKSTIFFFVSTFLLLLFGFAASLIYLS